MQPEIKNFKTISLTEAETKFQVSRSALKRQAKKIPGANKDASGKWLIPANVQIVKSKTGLKFLLPDEALTAQYLLQEGVTSNKASLDVRSLRSTEVLETGLRAFLEKIGIDGLLALPKARQALSHALIQEIWETIKT